MGNNGPTLRHTGRSSITPELSPRSTTYNSHGHPGQRGTHHPEPYNPFASVEETPSEGSVYSPPMYPVDRLDDPDGQVRFGNVDWKIKRPEPTRSRNISNLDQVKLDGNPPKPPFYRPVDSPPSHSNSPPYQATQPGRDLSLSGDRWSPHNEKAPALIATPPLTYYTPNKQENFRTNLDEKHTWDQTEHMTELQPFPEFEDVELARSNPPGLPPDLATPGQQKMDRVKSRRHKICFWIVVALIFIAPLTIALAILGGVYKWNLQREQCSLLGGSWQVDTTTCKYR